MSYRALLAAIGLTCLLFLFGWAHTAAAAERPPNVVLILCDDLGYGDLGCYGSTRFRTPRIDRLAREGARLTDFYSCFPYCAPSRATLLTGRYGFRTGMIRNPAPDAGINDVGLQASELTLGELFQKAGYATACIGKWHLGHLPQFHPLRHGFDEYLGILYSNDMFPVKLYDGEEMVEYPVYQATLTRRYTQRAIRFIERNKDRPFLLYLPHAMPHKPLAASEDFYGSSGAGLYADVMAELDYNVGELVDRLKELGLEQNTLVLFTSDNGPWYGGSTGGLRGMKSRTWDGGLRVPMIARWPGRIPAGHASRQPAVMLDLFTTVLRAAGIPLPEDRVIDGRDIMPLLTSDAPSPHEAFFGFHGDMLATVRSGKWKLHVKPPQPVVEKQWKPDEPWIDKRRPDGVRMIAPFEQYHPSEFPGVMTGDEVRGVALFDMETDPAEQHNVAEQYPEVVKRLQAYAEECQRQMAQEAAATRPAAKRK